MGVMDPSLGRGENEQKNPKTCILNPDDFELSQGFLLFEVLFNRFLVVERILFWRKGVFEDPSALHLSFKSRQSIGGLPQTTTRTRSGTSEQPGCLQKEK